MTHKHDHENHHGHGHGHGHDHETASEMAFPEKMEKLLNHWIKHNRDHVETYRKWADRAMEEGMLDVGKLVEEVAEISEKVDVALENALQRLKNKT